jgi:hypothetical protein
MKLAFRESESVISCRNALSSARSLPSTLALEPRAILIENKGEEFYTEFINLDLCLILPVRLAITPPKESTLINCVSGILAPREMFLSNRTQIDLCPNYATATKSLSSILSERTLSPPRLHQPKHTDAVKMVGRKGFYWRSKPTSPQQIESLIPICHAPLGMTTEIIARIHQNIAK